MYVPTEIWHTAHSILRGHPDGGDQPAKGPDAAADRTGLVAGERRSLDSEGPRTCDACQ